MRYAVIMAGGSGTRLWPMSTREQPKQLIPFLRGRSLLELAVDRLAGLVPDEHRCICTGEALRPMIRRAMPYIGDDQIQGEPVGRDTLNAVGFSAAILAKGDPDAVIATFTADHLIEPLELFQQRVNTGFDIAEKHPDALVTFGIRPTHPATGYGYVQLGDELEGFDHAYVVRQFREKPDLQTARQYVDSGQYLWNSGMFVWRAAALLKCIERFAPENYEGLVRIADAWGTPRQEETLREVYPQLKKISVDFAVMEPASEDNQIQVATVEMPVQWLDVGSWTSYADTCTRDEAGNAIANDRIVTIDTEDCLLASQDDDHLIATIGVKDLVIVHTPDATLICHRDHEQRIKQLHQQVGEKFGEQYI